MVPSEGGIYGKGYERDKRKDNTGKRTLTTGKKAPLRRRNTARTKTYHIGISKHGTQS